MKSSTMECSSLPSIGLLFHSNSALLSAREAYYQACEAASGVKCICGEREEEPTANTQLRSARFFIDENEKSVRCIISEPHPPTMIAKHEIERARQEPDGRSSVVVFTCAHVIFSCRRKATIAFSRFRRAHLGTVLSAANANSTDAPRN